MGKNKDVGFREIEMPFIINANAVLKNLLERRRHEQKVFSGVACSADSSAYSVFRL